MTAQSNTLKALVGMAVLAAGIFVSPTMAQTNDVQRHFPGINVTEYGLDFINDDAMNQFLADIQVVRNIAGAEAVERELIDMENELGFYSLAAQGADIDAGLVSAEEWNVDADRVNDPVMMSLLNPDLEIGVGGSIFKIMGGYVVEITDGDLDTLDWLRDVQRQRRFEVDNYGDATDVIDYLNGVEPARRFGSEEYDHNDGTVDWYADPQQQDRTNITVHEWSGSDDFDYRSGLSQPGPRFEAEDADNDGEIANLSTVSRPGSRFDADEFDAGLPAVFSTPVQQDRSVGDVDEYDNALGDGLASHQ